MMKPTPRFYRHLTQKEKGGISLKCLRCGYCCMTSLLVTIKPEFVQEKLDVEKLPEEAFLAVDGSRRKCPHLSFLNGDAVCAIHSKKWFKELPCAAYQQIGPEDWPCRVGEYLRNNPQLMIALYAQWIEKEIAK